MVRTEMGKLARTYAVGRRRRGEVNATTYQAMMRTLERWADSYGGREARNCSRSDLDRWLESIGHLKPATRRLHLSRVTSMLRWAVGAGHIRPAVLTELPKVKVPRQAVRTTTPEQTALILNSAPDARMGAIVSLMWWVGLRCVEVSRLNIEDFDRRNGDLFVTGKAGHERYVPVPPDLERALDRYLAEHPATSGPLIRSYRRVGYALLPQTLSAEVGRYLRSIGVKLHAWDGVSAHAGRRVAATDTYAVSGDIRVVQELLGHSNLTATERYLRRRDVHEVGEAVARRAYPPAA